VTPPDYQKDDVVAENIGCLVPGDECSEPGGSIAKGLCPKHYKRQRRLGGTGVEYLLKGPRRESSELWAFIHAAVEYEGDDCLIWPFSADTSGYGLIHWKGKQWKAHRLVLALVTGYAPTGRLIVAAHAPVICHTRLCLNPRHLRWDTAANNGLDKWLDKWLDGTQEHGEAVRLAKLTRKDVWAIRKSGESTYVLACRYGVSTTQVSHIMNGRSWTWLPNEDGTPYVPNVLAERRKAERERAMKAIELLAEGGRNNVQIGEMVGMAPRTVSAIRNGETWKDLPRPWVEPPRSPGKKAAA
jgi:hypothetical protein